MSYLLGIDIGTSGTKTLLIDEQGNVVASSTSEYPLSTLQPGWAEQDPQDWYDATVKTVRDVIAQSGVNPSEIAGLGLSGQMHGAVFLDGSGNVLRPSLLWCDQRTAAECAEITQKVGAKELVRITCNPVLTGFQAPKVVWVKNHEPEVYAKVQKVLLPKDYIRYRLTGTFATEVSDASGTSFLEVPTRRWSPEILMALDIPISWLPEVFESDVPSAKISAQGAADTGLAEGTPVVGGGGDQAAGAVGNGIVEPGIISSTVGTSGVVFAYSDEPSYDPQLRLHTFCHAVPGKWHAMGVMLSAGGSYRWLRDTMGFPNYDLMNELASIAPPGSEGLVFLPYLTGERAPHPDPYARGVFFGASIRHKQEHMIRSVLEGVAYGLRDSFEIMKEMGVPMSQVRASGGGARSSLWRQIQADVTGHPHVLINVDEGPAYGVALLAGVGAGVWPSVQEACRATIKVEQQTAPHADHVPIYNDFYEVYRGLYPALKSLFERDAQLVEKHLMSGESE
ncbi:MAG: xylulokinase [Armatimonadetes bacterium]|nr:xylulokinase [Armatimonadota bacterium]